MDAASPKMDTAADVTSPKTDAASEVACPKTDVISLRTKEQLVVCSLGNENSIYSHALQ